VAVASPVKGRWPPRANPGAEIDEAWRGRGKPVLPIVETGRGIDALDEIARAPGTARLVFGKLDLAVDLDLTPDEGDPEELVHLALAGEKIAALRLCRFTDSAHCKLDGDAAAMFGVRPTQIHWECTYLAKALDTDVFTRATSRRPRELTPTELDPQRRRKKRERAACICLKFT